MRQANQPITQPIAQPESQTVAFNPLANPLPQLIDQPWHAAGDLAPGSHIGGARSPRPALRSQGSLHSALAAHVPVGLLGRRAHTRDRQQGCVQHRLLERRRARSLREPDIAALAALRGIRCRGIQGTWGSRAASHMREWHTRHGVLTTHFHRPPRRPPIKLSSVFRRCTVPCTAVCTVYFFALSRGHGTAGRTRDAPRAWDAESEYCKLRLTAWDVARGAWGAVPVGASCGRLYFLYRTP